MFDTLTLNELYALHEKLGQEGEVLHGKFMALPNHITEEANLLIAECSEVSETMNAVYTQIRIRQVEAGILHA